MLCCTAQVRHIELPTGSAMTPDEWHGNQQPRARLTCSHRASPTHMCSVDHRTRMVPDYAAARARTCRLNHDDLIASRCRSGGTELTTSSSTGTLEQSCGTKGSHGGYRRDGNTMRLQCIDVDAFPHLASTAIISMLGAGLSTAPSPS